MLKWCRLCFVCGPESSSSWVWLCDTFSLKKKLKSLHRNPFSNCTEWSLRFDNWLYRINKLSIISPLVESSSFWPPPPTSSSAQAPLDVSWSLSFWPSPRPNAASRGKNSGSKHVESIWGEYPESVSESGAHLIVFLIDLGHFLFNLLLLLLLPLLLFHLGFKHSSQPLIPLPATSQGVVLINKELNLLTSTFIVSQGSPFQFVLSLLLLLLHLLHSLLLLLLLLFKSL